MAEATASGVWRLDWLTPARGRVLLVVVLLAGAAARLHYLHHDCPIDLSGDEAHYWDWSRQLDWSYYSKGPAVAWIIRASCLAFGETMPAVRYPALAFGVATALLTWLTARRLFGSERVALGAVLLCHLAPMFIAGSLIMTIDPPMFFCWAAASFLLVRAVLDRAGWAWPAMGAAVGAGVLAKYGMALWLLTPAALFLVDRAARPLLRTPGPWVMLAAAAACTAPIWIWNARHGWLSFRHVAAQTGGDAAALNPLHALEMVAGQIGALGPPLAVLFAAAVVAAWRDRGDTRRATRLLLCMSLPFLAVVALNSLRAKVQVNWPAPAYFGLTILAAWFLARRLRSAAEWRPWRGWFYAAVGLAAVAMPLIHHSQWLYPLNGLLNRVASLVRERPVEVRDWDPSFRLRGWEELGRAVGTHLEALGPGAFVLCEKYDVAGLMAFYVPGRPRTFYAASWFADPERRGRLTQYDLWADRALDQPALRGAHAVYIGYISDDVIAAFDRVEPQADVDIVRGGTKIRRHLIHRCYGFRGMTRPSDSASY